MTFGEAVVYRRRELGLSQTDLAKAVNISMATMCKIEHGHISHKSKAAKKVSDFLRLDEPIDITRLTGNKAVDLAMLEKRVCNALFELDIVLNIIQSMKGETNEESI